MFVFPAFKYEVQLVGPFVVVGPGEDLVVQVGPFVVGHLVAVVAAAVATEQC